MQTILHRLNVRKHLLKGIYDASVGAWVGALLTPVFALGSLLNSTLTLIWGLTIISRESGVIDAYSPLHPDYLKAIGSGETTVGLLLDQMVKRLSAANAAFGYGFILMSRSLTADNMLHVRWTNDLMRYQGQNIAGESGFGSRGNNKAVRANLGVATFPEIPSVTDSQPDPIPSTLEPLVTGQYPMATEQQLVEASASQPDVNYSAPTAGEMTVVGQPLEAVAEKLSTEVAAKGIDKAVADYRAEKEAAKARKAAKEAAKAKK